MNVAHILRSHAERHPHEVALVDAHRGRVRRMTFCELEQATGRTATLLGESGLRAGDTVLVFHPMSQELYVALGALLRRGVVAMFVDPSAGRKSIDRCCALRRPQAMIASSKVHWLRLISPELRRIPVKFSIGSRVPGTVPLEVAQRRPYDPAVNGCDADTPALISFTSGSTGGPKAAIRTHGLLLSQHRAIERNLILVPGESELVALPIFVLANLASRVTSIIPSTDLRQPDKIAPAPVVAQLQHLGATRTTASPAFYERLADYCEEHRITFPRLTKVFTGGGPVPSSLLRRLQMMAPQAAVTVVYGSTEAEPISCISLTEMQAGDHAAMLQGRGLLAGHPVPGIQLRIVKDQWGRKIEPCEREQFEQMCQSAGVGGEIVVSCDHVLPGYLYGPSDDENKLQVADVCWHRTGDAGYLDDLGRLWLLGRCAARIEDHRGAIYPLGAENTALQYEYVRRAAFVTHRGQRVMVVELHGHAVKPDVASLLQSLAFAGVDAIQLVKHIPVDRRHNTKVDYNALRELLS
jgi:acyl-CoA synthetase (AMP-forming)/AMP-acid ligase II